MRFLKLPSLPLLLAPLLLLAPVLFTGQALFWGTPSLQFVPWRFLAWEMLRSGQAPLWNPWVGMGAPLAANYQSALFYPPNWSLFLLAALGGVRWLAWGQGLLVMLHWMWAAAGMALLARQLGLGKLAQTVSGLAFGLSAYLVARSTFLSINAAAAWTPWVILMVCRLESLKVEGSGFNPRPSNSPTFQSSHLQPSILMLLSISIGMLLLAGHAQTAWYTLLLAGMWAGFLGWTKASHLDQGPSLSTCLPVYLPTKIPHRIRGTASAWARLGLALVLGLVLAAVQLLPTAEYLQQSQRAGEVGFDFAMTYSFWPWRFLTLFAPHLFGTPAQGDYWGYGNYWEDALYIGLLPLLLALAAVAGIRRWCTPKSAIRYQQSAISNRPSASRHSLPAVPLFLAFICLLSFALALGKNTPLFPWLYRHVPTFDMFQAPTRLSLWAEFGLALLAAYGVEAWRRPTGWGLYWTRLGTAGAFAVMLGAGLTAYFLGSVSPTFIRATALAGLWGVGVGVLSLLAPPSQCKEKDASPFHSFEAGSDPSLRATVPPSPGGGHGVRFLKNLLRRQARGQGVRPSEPPGSPRPPSTRLRVASKSGLWSCGVVALVAADLLLAGYGLNPGVHTDFYASPGQTAAEVEALAEGGRLYLPAQDEYHLKFERFFRFETYQPEAGWETLRAVLLPDTNLLDRIPSANNFDPLVPARYARWLEALEIADAPTRRLMLNLMAVRVVEKVEGARPYGVGFEQIAGGPRARWVPCARPADDGSRSLSELLKADLDPDSEVILEGLHQAQVESCQRSISGAELHPDSVRWVAESPDRLVLQVKAASAGWLVLSDTWYPGWRASVDGEPVPVLRANYLFRAVQVGPGEHEVEFIYRPFSFYAGALLSLLAWVGVFLWVFSTYRLKGSVGAGRRPAESPPGATYRRFFNSERE